MSSGKKKTLFIKPDNGLTKSAFTFLLILTHDDQKEIHYILFPFSLQLKYSYLVGTVFTYLKVLRFFSESKRGCLINGGTSIFPIPSNYSRKTKSVEIGLSYRYCHTVLHPVYKDWPIFEKDIIPEFEVLALSPEELYAGKIIAMTVDNFSCKLSLF